MAKTDRGLILIAQAEALLAPQRNVQADAPNEPLQACCLSPVTTSRFIAALFQHMHEGTRPNQTPAGCCQSAGSASAPMMDGRARRSAVDSAAQLLFC